MLTQSGDTADNERDILIGAPQSALDDILKASDDAVAYRTRSICNWLCDLARDTPIGETKPCGGDVLIRRDAFELVGWYRADLIVGEEPELCVRLRAGGWRIWRLDAEMTLHDAAMTRTASGGRAERSGYAFAQVCMVHGPSTIGFGNRGAPGFGAYGSARVLGGRDHLSAGWAVWLIYRLQVVRLSLRNSGAPRQRLVPGARSVSRGYPGDKSSRTTVYLAVNSASSNTSDDDQLYPDRTVLPN